MRQARGEEILARLVEQLEKESLVGNAVRAVLAANAPQIQRPNSQVVKYDLDLGDVDEHPQTSLRIPVIVSKSIAPATTQSMKKLSALHQGREGGGPNVIEPTKKRKAGEDGNLASFIESMTQDSAARDLIEAAARTLGVTLDKNWFYVHNNDINVKPLKSVTRKEEEEPGGDEEETKTPEEEEAEEEPVEQGRALSKAYKLGKTPIPLGDIGDEDALRLKHRSGLQILGFMKEYHVSGRLHISTYLPMGLAQVKPHWLHGDVHWVFAAPTDARAQVTASVLAMALEDTDSVALVRFVATARTTPLHMCALIPWWSDQEEDSAESDIKWGGFKLVQVRRSLELLIHKLNCSSASICRRPARLCFPVADNFDEQERQNVDGTSVSANKRNG